METVTLSREEYDDLVAARDMLEDVVAYDRAMAGSADALPHALMARLVDGEPPLGIFREWRGVSVAELSARSGVGPDEIEALERGAEPRSVASLKAIAAALDIEVDELI